MKKRFIILLDDSTKELDDQFLEWIKEQQLGWWHWLTNSWLLSNSSGHLSAGDVRDKVNKIYSSTANLVIEIGDEYDTWSGYGPSRENRSMFKWIKDNWRA